MSDQFEVTTAAALRDIFEVLTGLALDVAELKSRTPLSAPTEPAPPAPPAIPRRRIYAYNDKNLLADAEGVTYAVNGGRIDPVVDADCTTAVKVASGHFLSVPRVDLKETIIGYLTRVSKQAGGNLGRIGAFNMWSQRLFAPYGGFKTDGEHWADVADLFFNPPGVLDPNAIWTAADAAKRAAEQPVPAPVTPVEVPIN